MITSNDGLPIVLNETEIENVLDEISKIKWGSNSHIELVRMLVNIEKVPYKYIEQKIPKIEIYDDVLIKINPYIQKFGLFISFEAHTFKRNEICKKYYYWSFYRYSVNNESL